MAILDDERIVSYCKNDARLLITSLNDSSVIERHEDNSVQGVENVTNSFITKRPALLKKHENKLSVEILSADG